jgi:hypothetical protein
MTKQERNKSKQLDLRKDKDPLSAKILAKQVLIRGENRREFNDFVAKIRSETLTQTKTEEELLKKYIFSAWKLERLRRMERGLLNSQQAFSEEDEIWSDTKRRIRNLDKLKFTNELLLLNNQQDRLEKLMVKTLKQLREEQKFNKMKPCQKD